MRTSRARMSSGKASTSATTVSLRVSTLQLKVQHTKNDIRLGLGECPPAVPTPDNTVNSLARESNLIGEKCVRKREQKRSKLLI